MNNREKEYRVETYQTILKCNKCLSGEMIDTGEKMSNSFSFKAKHKCDFCGAIEMIENKSYPRTSYVRIYGE